MRRLVGTVSAVVCVVLLAGCTAPAPPPRPQSLPATPLDGWVRVATANSEGLAPGAAWMNVSPNGQWILYETDAVLPGDTDLHPTVTNLADRNVYLLDRTTGIHHLIRDWLATVLDVSDDGRALVFYRESPTETLLRLGVYTIAGGLVPLARPSWPTGCGVKVEDGGTGYELRCIDGSPTHAPGLYRFDAGDAVATPVAVAESLPSGMHVVATSENHRYLEVADGAFQWYSVYDDQTDTLLPSAIFADSVQPYFATDYNPVGVFDDGRMLVQVQVWGIKLDASRMSWFDPRTGAIEEFVGYGNASPIGSKWGTDFLLYEDWTREIGRHYWEEGRLGDHDVDSILGTFSSPTARWLIPDDSWLYNVTAAGDLTVSSAQLLDPNDTSPGVGIYVREGPLPAPPQ